MKKKVLILMIGILLIGVNLYAVGDLVVNGKVGVGTNTPAYKIHVESDNEESALRLKATFSNTPFTTNSGAYYAVKATQSGASLKRYIGFQGEVNLMGDGDNISAGGAENIVTFNATSNSYTNINGVGNSLILRKGSLNTRNHQLTNYYGIYSKGDSAGFGTIDGTDWRHAYFENFPSYGGTVANVAGLWIDQQTTGTNNYGIVLNGDGDGADIVFGTTQTERIYSSAGRLYAQDSSGNQTILSPHDPETGEWIYYSRNVKTGKVVRVDMERLVKAVEKLTGETFMIETLVEDK